MLATLRTLVQRTTHKMAYFFAEPLPIGKIEDQLVTFKNQFTSEMMSGSLDNIGVYRYVDMSIIIAELEYVLRMVSKCESSSTDRKKLSNDSIKLIRQLLESQDRASLSTYLQDTSTHPIAIIYDNFARLIYEQVKSQLSGEEDHKCHYQLRFPKLKQLTDTVMNEPLKNLSPQQFMLTDNGEEFFIIKDTLDFWAGTDTYEKPFRFTSSNEVVLLSPREIERLRLHSKEVADYYQAIENLQINKRSPSAASEIRKLIESLRANGVGRNGGTEYQANVNIFAGINAFKRYLEQIPQQNKTDILAARSQGGSVFGEVWNRLADTSTAAAQPIQARIGESDASFSARLATNLGTDNCVNIIANQLERILINNPGFDNSHLLQEQVNSAKQKYQDCFEGRTKFTPINSRESIYIESISDIMQKTQHRLDLNWYKVKEHILTSFKDASHFLLLLPSFNNTVIRRALDNMPELLSKIHFGREVAFPAIEIIKAIPIELRLEIMRMPKNAPLFRRTTSSASELTDRLLLLPGADCVPYINSFVGEIAIDNRDELFRLLSHVKTADTLAIKDILLRLSPDDISDLVLRSTAFGYWRFNSLLEEDVIYYKLFNNIGFPEVLETSAALAQDLERVFFFFPRRTVDFLTSNSDIDGFLNFLLRFPEGIRSELLYLAIRINPGYFIEKSELFFVALYYFGRECARTRFTAEMKLQCIAQLEQLQDSVPFTVMLSFLLYSRYSLSELIRRAIDGITLEESFLQPIEDRFFSQNTTSMLEYFHEIAHNAEEGLLPPEIHEKFMRGFKLFLMNRANDPHLLLENCIRFIDFYGNFCHRIPSQPHRLAAIDCCPEKLTQQFSLFLASNSHDFRQKIHVSKAFIKYYQWLSEGERSFKIPVDIRMLHTLSQCIFRQQRSSSEDIELPFSQRWQSFIDLANHVQPIETDVFIKVENIIIANDAEISRMLELDSHYINFMDSAILNTREEMLVRRLYLHPSATPVSLFENDFSVQYHASQNANFITTVLYTKLIQSPNYNLRIDTNNHYSMVDSRDGFSISRSQLKKIYSNLPAYLALIPSREKRIIVLKTMIDFYLKSRSLHENYLSAFSNSLLLLPHRLFGYTKQKKMDAANALLNIIENPNAPLTLEQAQALNQGDLGQCYKAYCINIKENPRQRTYFPAWR